MIVTIRRNSDGKTVDWHTDFAWHGPFVWERGNWSCDCNREIFFCEAAGIPEDEDCPCDESRYSVLAITVDGEVVYSDATSDEYGS